jgi:hypothetical protein
MIQIDTGYVRTVRNRNEQSSPKGQERHRVSDTMGLENVCPVLAHLLRTPDTIGTIRRKLNQDDTRPTENNNTPTTDFQICSNNQESK